MKQTLASLIAVLAASAASAAPLPAYVAAAIADPARPVAETARDGLRKPAAVMVFTGAKPGDRVADFMSGGGYFTRIFSRVVSPAGRVYAFLPDEELKNCSPKEVAGTRALGTDPAYRNLTVLTGPANGFAAPEPLDIVFTSKNYHDLHDAFMAPTSAAIFNKAVFAALKPGGAFIVIDHVAEPGSELRDTATRHRIDRAVVVREVEAAGFTLEAESDILRNPDDDHLRAVFNPTLWGHTDQMVLKFRKPRS